MARPKSSAEAQFYSSLHILGKLARFTFDEEGDLILMYDKLLSPLGYDRVNAALERIIAERRSNDPFPSVREIKAVLEESLSPEDQAPMIAGNILKAISQAGPYQQAKFRELVGDVGWRVVEMSGGLETVCQIHDREIGTNRAQWTRLAESLLRSRALGMTEERPKIEGPKGEAGLHPLAVIIKGQEDK
jgi:hypothetical protein